MAYPKRVGPWSEGKPPEAVRQAVGPPFSRVAALDDEGPAPTAFRQLLMTPEQAASGLSICRTKVYELIRTGQLESVQIGSSRRIPSDALSDYVERLREGSAFRKNTRTRSDRSHTGTWLIQPAENLEPDRADRPAS